ncbi:MAG: hypothetical protein V7K67_19075 [Nostoc sp.]|uniref:hypothetical protein n=1 Tax=Nostoc sp. TaxID=1180 RepID=UPI002FF76896
MKILDHKDAINHRQDEELIIVETAIYRVSCLNRTVLGCVVAKRRTVKKQGVGNS